jgi:eukaryotic-like serine/threonine-protein kinase
MGSRSKSGGDVIRVNGASIDLTSSHSIAFGYVSELARAGRLIGGRHRLQRPLPDPSSGKPSGTLWLAESPRLGSQVVVELLDPAIAEDASLADTFEWEARSAAAVTSPVVNRVLDYGFEASTPYLVTRLPYGENLAVRIARHDLPTAAELGRMFREIALAVEEIHALGLLHRDLRSDRIFLRRAAGAKLDAERQVASLSFGIAKLMNDTIELVRTMARRAVTPADVPRYVSPEQVLGTCAPDARSDLWSLAVIAFECMTGELPFVGTTMGERLVQICTGEARVPSRIGRVPPGFDAWFARGVRKAPGDRWSSALQMADALSAVLGA